MMHDHETIRCKDDAMKTKNGMLMLNVISHCMGHDDESDHSHDGCNSSPMKRRMCLDCS